MFVSGLLSSTSTRVIPYSGSVWNEDDVSGNSFIENLAAAFNARRPVQQVTTLIPMHVQFTQPAAGGIVTDGNEIIVFPFATNRVTFITIPLTGVAAVGRDTANTIPGGWRGGVSSNNDVAYAIPTTSNVVLKVPKYADFGPREPYETFGNFPSPTSPNDPNKWIGAVRAQNGKIYCVPHSATNILVIDPDNIRTDLTINSATDTFTATNHKLVVNDEIRFSTSGADLPEPLVADTIYYVISSGLTNDTFKISNTIGGSAIDITGSLSGTYEFVRPDKTYTFGSLPGNKKWWGGCLSPTNGKIYCMPHDSDTVLVIDPATDTVTTIGPIPSVGASSARFSSCCLSTSGKIYAIPYNASSVLSVDPQTDTVSVFGSLGGDVAKWEGGALGTDGKIYAAPFDSTSILVINPFTETTETFGTFSSGGGKWRNPVLGRNGQIFMIPSNINFDLLVVGQGGYNITRNITQSRYLNKF